MKKYKLVWMFCLVAILLGNAACTRVRSDVTVSQNTVIAQEVSDIQNTIVAQHILVPSYESVLEVCAVILNIWDNYGWLTEYEWYINNLLFYRPPDPRAIFRKINMPPGAALYQESLEMWCFIICIKQMIKLSLYPFMLQGSKVSVLI